LGGRQALSGQLLMYIYATRCAAALLAAAAGLEFSSGGNKERLFSNPLRVWQAHTAGP